jgi:hypothetical protein
MKRLRIITIAAAGAAAVGTVIVFSPSAGATPFGDACVITQGWVATVALANAEECHWQDPDGNEHVISNPLPAKPTLPTVQPAPGRSPS